MEVFGPVRGVIVLSGMSWTVLFLMATPYAVGGSIAAWLVYSYRRSIAAREGAKGRDPLHQGIETSKEVGQ